MARAVDPARLAAIRAARQLLHRPRSVSHPADIARAICGAQAQELPAGRLAFRSRDRSLTARDLDRARTEERSLVRTWAMRNTMHLIATDDHAWMRPLFAPMMAAFNRRRLGQLGLDADAQDRSLSLIRTALETDGPLSRDALTQRLAGKRIDLDAARRMHVFALSVSTAIACLGPDAGNTTLLAPARDWLPEAKEPSRDAALAELAHRYLAAFGPATEADFAGWAGLPLRDVRAGLAAVAPTIREVSIGGERAWTPRGRSPSIPPGLVRLLPAYDTYLMGYRDRAFLTTDDHWRAVGPGGGILRPTISVDGALAGIWRLRRSGRRLQVEPEPFDGLSSRVATAVEAEVADVERFEGARDG